MTLDIPVWRTLHTLFLLSPPLFPVDAINNRWAPVMRVVSLKGCIFEGERVGLPLSLERCPSYYPCPLEVFIASCNNCLPLSLKNVYNGHTDNELVIDTRPKEHCAHA